MTFLVGTEHSRASVYLPDSLLYDSAAYKISAASDQAQVPMQPQCCRKGWKYFRNEESTTPSYDQNLLKLRHQSYESRRKFLQTAEFVWKNATKRYITQKRVVFPLT